MENDIVNKYKSWYVGPENNGSRNSVNTIISAMRGTSFKNRGNSNGEAPIFSFSDYDSFVKQLQDSNLFDYLDRHEGNYNKYFGPVFNYREGTQLDDLKTGLKSYLKFLQSVKHITENLLIERGHIVPENKLQEIFQEIAKRDNLRDKADFVKDFSNPELGKRTQGQILLIAGLSQREIADLDVCESNTLNASFSNEFLPMLQEYFNNRIQSKPIGINSNLPRNKIHFGAPGVGKSYGMNGFASAHFDGRCDRVTFYSDYSYAQFVGTYKPTTDSSSDITYAFTPGPFTEILVKALNDDSDYLLIIEEINRADAAGVFGDVFQLLDRHHNGESEYGITPSKDLSEYLDKEVPNWRDKWNGKLKIPANMFIWATMNSADQSVFPLDTAFKRRWAFEYVGINKDDDNVQSAWNMWRKAINDKLKNLEIEEDKLMGAYFLSADLIRNDAEDITLAKLNNETNELELSRYSQEFQNKVLMYLFEDAARYHRSEIFGEQTISLSEIFERFESGAKKIARRIQDNVGNDADTKIEDYDILKLLHTGQVEKIVTN